MTFTLAVLLALQSDPRIEKVERLVGNVNRPVLWSPLAVTLSSSAGFKNDLVARSSFGFSVAVEVDLKPGASATVVLPAIDPEEVSAGKTLFRMPRQFVRVDHVVLVDARLRYADALVSTEKILYRKIPFETLKETLPRGLLEAADLILLEDGAGLRVGAAPAAVIAPTREAAQDAVNALPRDCPTLEVVERRIGALASGRGWVLAKKEKMIYLAGVYALALFVALGIVAKRRPRTALLVLGVIMGLSFVAYAFWFPRRHLWIEERVAETVREDGDTAEWRIWFAGAAVDLTTDIDFPRLVKPVFATPAGAEEPFTLRVGPRLCSVQGLRLVPGRTVGFAGVTSGEGRPPARALYDAVRVKGGEARARGDLPEGADPKQFDPQGPRPLDPTYELWQRFIGSDGLWGILNKEDRPAGNVKSADLAEARERPRLFIQRFK